MVLEVLRHRLSGIQTRLDLGVGDVAAYDDGAVEAQAGAYRVLGKLSEDFLHRLVEVDSYSLALTCIAELLRDELVWLVVHLLDPDTVSVDLGLDVAVCRAAYAKAYRTAGTVTRESYDTDVVGHILASELGSEADFVGLLKELLLELDVAEGTAGLIAGSRQAVVIMSGSELDGQKVLLGRGSAHNDCDMIWRAGCRAEALHLLDQERNEGSRVLDAGLGLLIQVSLVGRAAALGHAEEAVLHSFCGLDVNLGRKIALGVHLVVHIQRGIL